jgi:hypothetical protein
MTAGLWLIIALLAQDPGIQIPMQGLTGNLQWRVRTAPNLKTGGMMVAADVQSRDRIPTKNGPEAPSLMVRCSAGTVNLIVASNAMGKVVEVGGKRGVPFLVQYDAGATRTVLAGESQQHDAFLLPNAAAEVGKMEKAKTVRLSFERFQGGKVTFAFNISGFDEARADLRKGCPTLP